MNKQIVLDIETYGNIRDMSSLIVTVASIYEYEHDTYRSFEEKELGQLWPILERADLLIGYNSQFFDIPILDKYYPGDLTRFPHLDLLVRIKESSGKRFKLDDVAKATLGIQKSAEGLQAIKWYEEGKMEEIKQYCEQDVKVTKELYDFGREQGTISYPTLTGEQLPLPVNFKYDEAVSQAATSSTINMTLPF